MIRVKLLRDAIHLGLFAGEVAGVEDTEAERLRLQGRVEILREKPEQIQPAEKPEAPPPEEALVAEEKPSDGRQIVHKGRGVWAVIDEMGEEVAGGLTKEEAAAMIGQTEEDS